MAHPRAAVLVMAVLLAAVAGCRTDHGAASRPSASPSGPPAASPSARTVPSNAAAKSTVGSGGGPSIGGCPSFPAGNVWNADVAHLPVSSHSAAYVAAIGTGGTLHADFGAGSWQGTKMGFSVAYVKRGQPLVKVGFDYAGESDRVGYPIPRDAPVEGGPNADGDRHVLVVNTGTCKLYELFDAHPNGDGSWHAGSGAVFDLRSNHLRPAGWTSADAAGLPITPGLVRRDEVRRGRITHALRITVPHTAARYVWPARHSAGAASTSLPPMGLRLRLKAGVRISGYPRDAQVILRALKTYGAIVADNGSAWYLSGTNDPGWNNEVLGALKGIKGADFEALDSGSLMADRDSGGVRG